MGKFKYLIIPLTVCLLLLGVFSLYLGFGCKYTGVEFSPDDFTVRRFSYNYEPMTNWVISGRTFNKADEYDSDFLSRYRYASMPDLVADKFIKPVFKKEKTWHLIEDNGQYRNGFSSDSDARLLVDFLLLDGQDLNNIWTEWNSDHPKLAKILWPLIAEMARDEAYLTISDVLTFALDSEQLEPKPFETELRKEVASAYLKLAQIDFDNDNLESAKSRVKKSIKFHSEDKAKTLLNRIQSVK